MDVQNPADPKLFQVRFTLAGECLLLFGAESFVFQFAIQKFKHQDI